MTERGNGESIEIICLICPAGCRLTVDALGNVTGNTCERGAEYGRQEVLNPVRTLTSTVRIEGGAIRRCPVRTKVMIPKGVMIDAAKALDTVSLRAPVKTGHTFTISVNDTAIEFMVTKNIGMIDC